MRLHPALEKNVQRLSCFSMPSVVVTLSLHLRFMENNDMENLTKSTICGENIF